MEMNKDLTVGKPGTVLWKFCLPLFGSVIFQQLYNIADSLVAGKFIGENALAAVGNSYEITLVFIAFATGLNIGCSVITSQLYGAGNHRDMKSGVYTSLITSGAVCLILMAFGILGGKWLLTLINTPAGILSDSALYLMIYTLGLPFLFFYNIANGIFSALGDSRTPFYFLAASSISNIGVDILFVAAFNMGVAGVAWATFICQGISCILAMVVVFKRFAGIKTEGKVPVFSQNLLKKFLGIAIPSILQQSFISVGNIIIQSAINSLGTGVMAGYSAAIKLNNLVITSFSTIGNGISNYTGQNIGAGLKDRIRKGFRAGVWFVWIICAVFVAIYEIFGRGLIGFFISDATKEAMHSGIMFLRIVSPFYFVVSVKLVADGILRGAGLMKEFMIGTFTDLILRVVLALVFAGLWGYIGIWCAWPVGWSIATAVSVVFYLVSSKKDFIKA